MYTSTKVRIKANKVATIIIIMHKYHIANGLEIFGLGVGEVTSMNSGYSKYDDASDKFSKERVEYVVLRVSKVVEYGEFSDKTFSKIRSQRKSCSSETVAEKVEVSLGSITTAT